MCETISQSSFFGNILGACCTRTRKLVTVNLFFVCLLLFVVIVGVWEVTTPVVSVYLVNCGMNKKRETKRKRKNSKLKFESRLNCHGSASWWRGQKESNIAIAVPI